MTAVVMSRPGFAFESACPACESPLTVINNSRPATTYETAIIVQCAGCRLQAEVRATLTVLHDPRYTRPPKGGML